MALDDTAADTGTIFYVRGSNHWPRAGKGGQFHAPDDWLVHVRDAAPDGASSSSPSPGRRYLRVDRVRRSVPFQRVARRDHVADDRAPLAVGALVRRAAVEGPAVVERGAAGRHLDRHQLELHARRASTSRTCAEPVVGGVELPPCAGVRPVVRAADVVDRPGVGVRVVERHPAGGHVRRRRSSPGTRRPGGRAAPCPTAASRSRCPGAAAARAAGERGAELAVPRGERRWRRASGRPSRRCTAGASGRAACRRVVVDLVGRQARLPLVGEAAREVLAQALDLRGGSHSSMTRKPSRR